jgi:hypothetical protein
MVVSISPPPAAFPYKLPLHHDRLGPPRERNSGKTGPSAHRSGGCGQGTMCDLEVTGPPSLLLRTDQVIE